MKDFKKGKERLELPKEKKHQICKLMFNDVCLALEKSYKVDEIIIVSSDKNLFKNLHSKFNGVLENSSEGLNHAIQLGISSLDFEKNDSLLILHSDLPLLQPNDVNSYFEMSQESEKILILTPSLRKDGTNAILLKPPTIFKPIFGKNSFDRHLKRAQTIPELQVQVFRNENVALDIDTIADLKLLIQKEAESQTKHYSIKEGIK